MILAIWSIALYHKYPLKTWTGMIPTVIVIFSSIFFGLYWMFLIYINENRRNPPKIESIVAMNVNGGWLSHQLQSSNWHLQGYCTICTCRPFPNLQQFPFSNLCNQWTIVCHNTCSPNTFHQFSHFNGASVGWVNIYIFCSITLTIILMPLLNYANCMFK